LGPTPNVVWASENLESRNSEISGGKLLRGNMGAMKNGILAKST
jgi:hypothetical protein